MLTRRLFIGGLAALAGCTYAPRPVKDLRKHNSFLDYPENINTVAKFILENDLNQIGETGFAVYGPESNVRITSLRMNSTFNNLTTKIRNKPLTEADKILIRILMGGMYDSGLHNELVDFVLGGETHPAEEYFYDLLDSSADFQGSVMQKFPDADLLLFAHAHPYHLPRCVLSGTDKEKGIPAFAYEKGKLVYLSFDNNEEEHRRYDISDSELIAKLDLATARNLSRRDNVKISKNGIATSEFLANSIKYLRRGARNPASQKEDVAQTIDYVLDRIYNRLKYIDFHEKTSANMAYLSIDRMLRRMVDKNGIELARKDPRDSYVETFMPKKPEVKKVPEVDVAPAGVPPESTNYTLPIVGQ